MCSSDLSASVLGLDVPGMEALPGGQGIIYRVKDGVHSLIE